MKLQTISKQTHFKLITYRVCVRIIHTLHKYENAQRFQLLYHLHTHKQLF